MKRCAKCQTTKPLADFNKSKKGAQGRQRYCRSCQNAFYKATREKRIAQTADSKRRHYFTKYGLTFEEGEAFRARNNGLCECCHTRPGIHIDHDHITGELRGHLCSQCNTGIGMLGDSLEGVQNALTYLSN